MEPQTPVISKPWIFLLRSWGSWAAEHILRMNLQTSIVLKNLQKYLKDSSWKNKFHISSEKKYDFENAERIIFSAFFCLRNTEKKVKHRHKSCFIPLSGKKKKYSCNNLAFSTWQKIRKEVNYSFRVIEKQSYPRRKKCPNCPFWRFLPPILHFLQKTIFTTLSEIPIC